MDSQSFSSSILVLHQSLEWCEGDEFCAQLRIVGMPVVSPELELDSGGTSSTHQVKAVRRSKHDDGKRRRTKRDGALLTWKEQLGQLLAIVATAAAVYYVTESSIGWLKEARRPFCDNLDPEQATSGMNRAPLLISHVFCAVLLVSCLSATEMIKR